MGMYGRMVAWETGSDPGDARDRLEGEGSADLDKDWDVVLRLLEVVSGGRVMSSMVPVGDEIGYGPPQLVPAQVVAELATSLREMTPSDVQTMLNEMDLDDAYPGVWWLFGFQRGVMVGSRSQLGCPA